MTSIDSDSYAIKSLIYTVFSVCSIDSYIETIDNCDFSSGTCEDNKIVVDYYGVLR